MTTRDRGKDTPTSDPSPAQLRAHADELRELARRQGDRAGSVGTLLDPVTALDDGETWQGTFAGQTRTTLGGRAKGLRTTAEQCHDDLPT